jgi:hypothetical protein
MEDHGGMIITAENSLFVQHSHLVTNQEELDKGDNEFSLRNIYVNTSKLYLHAVKSYYMGPTALLPLRSKPCCGFLSPSKIQRLGRV